MLGFAIPLVYAKYMHIGYRRIKVSQPASYVPQLAVSQSHFANFHRWLETAEGNCGARLMAKVTPDHGMNAGLFLVRPSKELALCTACLSRRSERGLATICRRSGRGRE